MRASFVSAFALLLVATSFFALAQNLSKSAAPKTVSHDSIFPLHETSAAAISGQLGGASSAKCDPYGNIYIRGTAAMDKPLLAPVIKIDPSGKIVAKFNPADFAPLSLDRADAFSPASDGGLYQIAQKGVVKPDIYVLRFSSDGSTSSSPHLDADFEAYTFAAFLDGTFLVSGLKRDLSNINNKNNKDKASNFTVVFSADGRQLSQLHFKKVDPKVQKQDKKSSVIGEPKPGQPGADELSLVLDLADAETGNDGYLYLMRRSAPAVAFVVSASGQIMHTFKVVSPEANAMPTAFHLSGNRMAVLFFDDKSEKSLIVTVDAQSGQKLATYSIPNALGTTFACYSADDDSFTFLRSTEKGTEIVKAEGN